MKQFKIILLTTFFLCFSIFSFSQSKWTCFPNNDTLHFSSGTWGMFNYTDNSTWMINTDGIYIYNESKWSIVDYKKQLSHKYIYNYLVDSKHNVWIGFGLPPNADKRQSFNFGGISQYNGKKWTNFKNEDLNISPPNINHIFEAPNGDIWFSSVGFSSHVYVPSILFNTGLQSEVKTISGLIQYSQDKWTNYGQSPLAKENSEICNIFETEDKRIWFWLASNKLFYFENNIFTEADKKIGYFDYNGNTPDIVRPMFASIYHGESHRVSFDSKKDLWLTDCGSNMIAKYTNHIWKLYSKNSFEKAFLYPCFFVMKDNSVAIVAIANVWSLSNSYILIYKLDGFDQWKLEFNIKINKFILQNNWYNQFDRSDALDTSRNVWFIRRGGVGVYDGSEFKWDMQKNDLKILFIDHENRIWAASDKALYLKEDTWKNFDNINKVKAFLEDKSGTVWILTEKDGLVSYSNGKWETYTEKNGLLSSKIIQIYLTPDNTLWVITDKGLCKFNRN